MIRVLAQDDHGEPYEVDGEPLGNPKGPTKVSVRTASEERIYTRSYQRADGAWVYRFAHSHSLPNG